MSGVWCLVSGNSGSCGIFCYNTISSSLYSLWRFISTDIHFGVESLIAFDICEDGIDAHTSVFAGRGGFQLKIFSIAGNTYKFGFVIDDAIDKAIAGERGIASVSAIGEIVIGVHRARHLHLNGLFVFAAPDAIGEIGLR